MKIKRGHNTEIVLSYLFNEGILEHFGSWKKVSLQDDKEGNKVLCMKGYKFYNISKKGEEIYLPMDISFFYFIKLCEAMSKEQIVGLIASNILTRLKQKREYKEMLNKEPIAVEVFSDNGGHSHWELRDVDTGELLWEEKEEENE